MFAEPRAASCALSPGARCVWGLVATLGLFEAFPGLHLTRGCLTHIKNGGGVLVSSPFPGCLLKTQRPLAFCSGDERQETEPGWETTLDVVKGDAILFQFDSLAFYYEIVKRTERAGEFPREHPPALHPGSPGAVSLRSLGPSPSLRPGLGLPVSLATFHFQASCRQAIC